MKNGVILFNLEKVMRDKNISKRALARAINTSISVITRYENNKQCRRERAEKIADFIGVELNELLNEKYYDEEIIYDTHCSNQRCPLCKNSICINDVVLSGRGSCASKDKFASKININVL